MTPSQASAIALIAVNLPLNSAKVVVRVDDRQAQLDCPCCSVTGRPGLEGAYVADYWMIL